MTCCKLRLAYSPAHVLDVALQTHVWPGSLTCLFIQTAADFDYGITSLKTGDGSMIVKVNIPFCLFHDLWSHPAGGANKSVP